MLKEESSKGAKTKKESETRNLIEFQSWSRTLVAGPTPCQWTHVDDGGKNYTHDKICLILWLSIFYFCVNLVVFVVEVFFFAAAAAATGCGGKKRFETLEVVKQPSFRAIRPIIIMNSICS